MGKGADIVEEECALYLDAAAAAAVTSSTLPGASVFSVIDELRG